MKTISFVLPCYKEEKNISLVTERIKEVIDNLEHFNLEILCIDDKSPDNTIGILRGLSKAHAYIKYVKLAKNVGSHMAIACGLKEAKGDCVIVLAADGQDPPEFSTELIREWENGAKVVWGARNSFKRNFLDQIFSSGYYWIMKKFSDANLHESGADMVLLDRVVIDIFNTIEEKNSSIWALIGSLGFDQVTCKYDKQERIYGSSNWTFTKKVKAALDTFISFSNFPIRFALSIGLLISFSTLFIIILYITNYILGGSIIGPFIEKGWLSVFLSIFFFGGMQMLILAVIGEYLIRILDQVKKRPSFIIEEKSDDLLRDSPDGSRATSEGDNEVQGD